MRGRQGWRAILLGCCENRYVHMEPGRFRHHLVLAARGRHLRLATRASRQVKLQLAPVVGFEQTEQLVPNSFAELITWYHRSLISHATSDEAWQRQRASAF